MTLLPAPYTPTPLVSVSITVYNCASWLGRAIESVLQQKTTFTIEIVITDDCSTDASLEIAHAYRDKHPDLIRVIERDHNVGVQQNTFDSFECCRGTYIAWLDADDYWTAPDKLAVQVEIMQSDASISVCGHRVRVVTSNGDVLQASTPSLAAGRYGLRDIILRNIPPALSVMFRNGIHRQLPDWYFSFQSLSDWPLWIIAARSGDIVLLDRIMADYMLAPHSSFSSRGELFAQRMEVILYEHVESILPSNLHRLARAEHGRRYEHIAHLLRKQGQFTESRKAAWKAFRIPTLKDRWFSKTKALLASVMREVEWRIGVRSKPTTTVV